MYENAFQLYDDENIFGIFLTNMDFDEFVDKVYEYKSSDEEEYNISDLIEYLRTFEPKIEFEYLDVDDMSAIYF